MSLLLSNQQLFVLNTLIDGDKYGYNIVKELKENNGINILLGSLYNLLKILEKKGYVRSYWGDDKNEGGRRKYYEITSEGITVYQSEVIKLKTLFA